MKCIKINCNCKKGIKLAIYDTVINYVTFTQHLIVLGSQTAPQKSNLSVLVMIGGQGKELLIV
jgi:hypothetical protein